ncbi:putative RNA methyltransferase [Fontibacillus phaseoli]|uniref:putative RNA methyltransferase n=1 Tax=Fontibacillus phaseoli TaxID=1416533 RepID=UPI001FE8BF8F|nr:methyltransferase domain-containing protein [Fontibacillus phaseoli]
MSKNNEKNSKARILSKYEDMFVCPVCSSFMKVVNLKSFICSKHHCFDIAKQGYVNLLPHPFKTKYDKQLFEARRMISQSGFFDPLLARISEIMMENLQSESKLIKILDAGCGEGSHLSQIQQRIMDQSQCNLLGIGIDISKEGIHMASRGTSGKAIWCVADLAKCPFVDQQFNFILNILSPSSYSEFHRMLADGGMVIKVIPESKYLQELRGIFYKQSDRTVYSNENTIELFNRNFDLVELQRIQYGVTMENKYIEQLVRMTPLSWGASEELKQQVLGKDKLEITCDFSVLLGKKMSARRTN